MLKCPREQLPDALASSPPPILVRLLRRLLEQAEFVDRQLEQLQRWIAERMQGWQEAVARLAEIPGIRLLETQ